MVIKELIETTLRVPVLEEPQPLYNKCATYNSYYEAPGLIGDGKTNENIQYIQIDLWYRKRLELNTSVKLLLDELQNHCYFSIPTIEKSCYLVTKLWRAIIKFEKIGGND